MNRQQKESMVQELSEKFLSNEASFIINCQGLTVAQVQQLRMALGEKNSEMQVAKNRLVRIAIQDKPGCGMLDESLKGQNAVVFAQSDLTGTAKVIYDFAKENEELEIVAGCYASQFLDKQSVEALAKLPSREVLLAQVCGTMKAPITSFVIVLKQVLVKMLLVMKAIAEKKS
ncbi:MAG: 50S ribosomal protein L10 [Epsilonproteobacteria bacterium]|nr:50S ribosomal protein L10 [Campylobacterota bacterium]|tara:strand:+ start:895 stop:1413 length:519 start_codon:yes stop_codon:yes gene_type:complete